MATVHRVRLTAKLLEAAYRQGLFPMGDSRGRIVWFCPDPRAIIPMRGLHVSRSLRRSARRYEVTFDTAYREVMSRCAARDEGTWITPQFLELYTEMHRLSKGHSAEAWRDGRLVGGVYGVALGGAFMAESMFHSETDAGKVALWRLMEHLERRGFELFDVQFLTPHLASLGAIEIPAKEYLRLLKRALSLQVKKVE
ncbi:MAG: leucyl/phenylalanyl-tRNA--protein transferase [Armatimonadota bacterium]